MKRRVKDEKRLLVFGWSLSMMTLVLAGCGSTSGNQDSGSSGAFCKDISKRVVDGGRTWWTSYKIWFSKWWSRYSRETT